VLVDMRARLRASGDERRIFNVTVEAAREAGLVGARRVLDSTPLYDAVATMDTVTLIRSAIRGVLAAADAALEAELRANLRSGDDYTSPAKPRIDWDDAAARETLIDSRALDAMACLMVLDGRTVHVEVAQAAELLATVVGQDLAMGDDDVFRIARRVAPDRVLSTVDPDARHGHKTEARSFDGYKGHVSIDPDSEIITATAVSAANTGDASVASQLLDDLTGGDSGQDTGADASQARPVVYGDAAYGTGELLGELEAAGINPVCKTQIPAGLGGRFSKDRFTIDLTADTVTCPAGVTVPIRRHADGGGSARFADRCATCPLAPQCTTSSDGRDIRINPHEDTLARARRRRRDPEWVADYQANRPKVERKIGHLMRRRHGGRRARVRGRARVDADFNLLAAAVNLARLAALGLGSTLTGGWTAAA
jgi:hypothetical protein